MLQRSRIISQPLIICGLFTLALFPDASPAQSQTNASGAQAGSAYNIRVSVDEVILTFHAADAHGLPINDLKHSEISILDDGKPGKMLDFYVNENHPIRAGILMDTSKSVEQNLPRNRAIAIQYAQRMLRQQTDYAFVMDFGYASNTIHPWTSDPIALTSAIHRVIAGRENPLDGTALFDTLYRACFYEFAKVNAAASGNFILLFSDGEDNVSHTTLKEVVDVCQSNNIAIYAFRTEKKIGLFSDGPKTLVELASQTGGRVFHDDDSESEIVSDLRTIEADLRNQYRLVYHPPELKHDGSFHRIQLKAPERVDMIVVRSGYYAPAH